jgi:hypothetical protein
MSSTGDATKEARKEELRQKKLRRSKEQMAKKGTKITF